MSASLSVTSAVPCSSPPWLLSLWLTEHSLVIHGVISTLRIASLAVASCTRSLPPAVPALLHQIPVCPGLKCLEFCSGGFLSPASRLDAGSALGHGRWSTRNRQRFPLFVRVNTRGFDVPHIRVGMHNCASKPERFMGYRCVGHF